MLGSYSLLRTRQPWWDGVGREAWLVGPMLWMDVFKYGEPYGIAFGTGVLAAGLGGHQLQGTERCFLLHLLEVPMSCVTVINEHT